MGIAWEDLAIVADGHAYTDGGASANAWAHSSVSMLHAIIVVVLLKQYTIVTSVRGTRKRRKKNKKKEIIFQARIEKPEIHKKTFQSSNQEKRRSSQRWHVRERRLVRSLRHVAVASAVLCSRAPTVHLFSFICDRWRAN